VVAIKGSLHLPISLSFEKIKKINAGSKLIIDSSVFRSP
jgi:hypothetical protein